MAIGDRLRSAITLWGAPSCIHTAACLLIAGEKGLDITAEIFDPNSSEMKSLTPLGIGPVIKHVDHIVTGHSGIVSYFDDKGFGPSLIVRNGVVRSIQYQWVQYAIDVVQPNMDDDRVLERCFAALAKQLKNTSPSLRGDYICGSFSTVDAYWAACVNLLSINGKGGAFEKHDSISAWFSKVKSHPSTSKEDIKPFTCMPTKEDVNSGTLRNISINV